MKKIIALFLTFIPMVLAMGQQLKNTNLKIDQWGSHRNLFGSHGVWGYPMVVDDNCIYFGNLVDGIDTIYCFNTAKNKITSSVFKEGIIIPTSDGLRLFITTKDEDNQKVIFKSCLLDNSLKHKSEKEVFSANIDKKGRYSCYASVSPDSSKVGFLVGIDYGDTRQHVYVLYDRLKGEFEVNQIRFKMSSTYYSIINICLTDEGKMFVMIKSQDDGNDKKASTFYYDANLIDADGSVEKQTLSLGKDCLYHDFKCKVLHNGKILWAMTAPNAVKKWTEMYLYYNMVDPNRFDNGEVKKYVFQDVWLEKQKVSLKKYLTMSLDYLTELDNGKVYALGFPYEITTACSNYGCSQVNNWGGFYCLGINESGEVDDFNYIERMAKHMRSSLTSLPESNLGYDAVSYGNNLYLTFNEAVKKVENGKITASVTPKDEEAYVMMYRIGEDGLKKFNLSGSKPSDRLFNSFIGRKGNRFYYLTRNKDFGSISYVVMPEVAVKDFTRKPGQNKVSTVTNPTSEEIKEVVPANEVKKTESVRKRTVKR